MKTKLFKRLTAAALALLMVAASVPSGSDFSQLFTGSGIVASAQTDSGKCGDNATWEYNAATKKLTISGTGDMWDYKFDYTYNVPGTPWYDYREEIKTVEISEGITKVGTMAFYSLKRLTSVSISSTVKKINGYAFTYCSSLSSLTFAGESKLEFIGDHSFLSVNLTDIVLPEGVTTIDYSAFGNSNSIKSVTLPSTISSINENAFAHCSNLDNIYIYSNPSNLTWNANQYESGNFKPNKGTKCHVPKEYYATYIQKYAKGEDTDINVTFVGFGKCGDNAIWELDEKTGKLTIGGTGAMWEFQTGYNDGETILMTNASWGEFLPDITTVEIGKNITSIGQDAFSYADYTEKKTKCGIQSVTFEQGSTLESIGVNAFAYCMNLGSITIPATVTSISARAFSFCNSLETVTFENDSKLETIGGYAFSVCGRLKTITLPASVNTIYPNAFNECNNLTDIYISSEPSQLTWTVGNYESYNFKPNKGTKCHVPVEYLSAYKAKFAKGEDTDINVSFVCDGKCGDNAYWSYNAVNKVLTISGSGAMYDYTSNDKIPWYSIRSEIAELDISNGITHIGNRSFYGLDNESFTSVFIPAGVESIGSYAFCGCSRVSSISFSENSKLRTIGEYAFNSCTDLSMLCLPEGLTSVKDYAFDNCVSISMIVMPGSISEIGDGAFMNCNYVDSIYFTSAPDFSWSWKETAVDGYFRPNKGTECFVPGKYISAYKEKFGATANATITAENLCGDNAYWEFDEESGKLTIGGTGAMWDYECDFSPDMELTTAPWKELLVEIQSVEIGKDITSIGNNAFCFLDHSADPHFTSIQSVTFEKGSKLKSIGERAFSYCYNLTSFTVPASVEEIKESAFYNCPKLAKFDFESNSKLETIGYGVFYGLDKLGSIIIPASVKNIQADVFVGCFKLTDIYMSADPNKEGFSWLDNNPDSFKPNKATKCHVPKQYYSAYKAKFAKGANTDVNVTFVSDDCKVTVAKTTNGTVTANKSSGQSGETITLTVKPNTGYKLKSLTVKDSAGKTVTVTSNKFTLPASDVTITAVFEKQTYTIQFRGTDGKALQILTVAYGDTPKYTGTTPTKAKTAQYTYTFSGWAPSIVKATADATYTATFTSTTNKYTLTLPKNMSVVGTAAASYEYGTVVKFEADSGYSVIKQVRNGSTVLTPTDGAYSVTITANTTITAITGLRIDAAPATCTEDGNIAYNEGSDGKLYKTSDCTVITKEQTVIKATGHNYTAKWTWTKNKVTGGYSCKADIKCGKCNASKNNIAAKITEKSSSKEICGKKRTVKYIAKVTYGGKTFTVNKTVIVTVSHNYSDWKTTSFNVNNRTSVQKRTCSRCKKTESKTVKNSVVRFAGNDRAQTAALISNSTKHGMYKTADTVVIATGFDFHDALAAVPLASAYNAPLLLADRDNLSLTTIKEIKRLKAKNVIVVATKNAKDNNGKKAAIGDNVYKQLKELKVTVTKLTGKDYYETAAKVADKLQKKKRKPNEIFVTTDKNYADALTVASIAAVKGAPIIYVSDKKISNDTTALLKKFESSVKNVYIVGGNKAVSKDVEESLKGILKKATIKRYAGDDRYDTAIKINNAFSSVFKGKSLCITTGQNFPDALAGGVYAAKKLSPMLLVNGAQTTLKLTDAQKSYLKSRKIDSIAIFGGKTAVSDSIVKMIAKASVK